HRCRPEHRGHTLAPALGLQQVPHARPRGSDELARREGDPLQRGQQGLHGEVPYVAQAVKNFAMSEEQLADLEALMFSEDEYNGENLEDAVAEWLYDNPDFVDDYRAGYLAG